MAKSPSFDSALVCSTCQVVAARQGGFLVLGIRRENRVRFVCAVDFYCTDACHSNACDRPLAEETKLLSVSDLDPFLEVEATITKYCWHRGMLERYLDALRHVLEWSTQTARS